MYTMSMWEPPPPGKLHCLCQIVMQSGKLATCRTGQFCRNKQNTLKCFMFFLYFLIKEIFSDSNNISYGMNQKIKKKKKKKHLISNIPVDSNFTFSSYEWLFVFHCSHRLLCWRKSSVRDFCENCSHFILKWFQPNFFGEVYFLEESYENIQKIPILKIFRASSIQSGSMSLTLMMYNFGCNVEEIKFN